MQTTATTKITIGRPPSEVFAYLTDLRHHYLWNPQVQAISTTKRLKLGATFKTESQVLGITFKTVNTVTSFKPPKELVLVNPIGAVVYTAKFMLSPQGGKTYVKLQVTISTDANVFVFAKPVLRQLALRELRTDLQALKVAIENDLQ